MNNRRIQQTLLKLIAHIDHTLEYCDGLDFDGFMADRMRQEACVFNLLQIGELSRNGLDEAFIAALKAAAAVVELSPLIASFSRSKSTWYSGV